MPLKTLFLNPPSFENFDGGASSRWPATREIESYWYPVWLAYPAGMLEGSRLLDAPPHHVSAQETIEMTRDYEFLVLFTSTPGFKGDCAMATRMKEVNPRLKICFVGPHVTTLPEQTLNDCPAIDFIVRREFDFATVEFANGKPLSEILGISYRKNGSVAHNADRPEISDLDALPDAVDVYKRDLDVRRYNVPFSALSVSFVLHHARLPGAVHVLLVAAIAERTSLAQTLHRSGRPGDGQGQRILA
jgi:radical SAM superfamily enzyme YgiQ (UPF0313 family)